MTEITPAIEHSRLLSETQSSALYQDILNTIETEPWRDAANANRSAVEALVRNGIDLIQRFEKATRHKSPRIHLDTDVIYIDSGPGPYSYNMLEPGEKDLKDKSYHGWKWSRKMDRARINAAYALASIVTAQRTNKPAEELTAKDFETDGPYLMYTSTDWQNSSVTYAKNLAREAGNFRIPDSKIVMYETFTTRDGEIKPIIHTEDQMEGLRFPNNEDGTPPRRIVIVSQPAHIVRILHILGKYPGSIPAESVLQLFPISTPIKAGTEYTTAEIMGTLATIFRKQRASLEPFTRYEV